MKRLMPDCNENIIVGVFYNRKFSWFLTDKEIWFLDYRKRIDAFKEKGFHIEEYIDDIRKDTLILNSDNAKIFLEKIKAYQIDSKKLRELLEKSKTPDDDSWYYDFRPGLYVDFDSCKLFSLYSEPSSYEEYTPKDWESKYFDFMEIIPDDYKYWQNSKNENLLTKE